MRMQRRFPPSLPDAPSWMSDARIRRRISDSIRRRRAKRKRELAEFETTIRRAEQENLLAYLEST
jgi:hypothetical protein